MSSSEHDGICNGCYTYWFKLNLWQTESPPAKKITIEGIQTFAKHGCPCCRIVAASFSAMTPAWLTKIQNNHFLLQWNSESITISVPGDTETGGLVIYQYGESSSATEIPLARRNEVAHDTHSQDAFCKANTWLANCVANHEGCRQPFFLSRPLPNLHTKTSFTPTRALDVDGAGKDRIILVDRAHSSAAYACLSYCWGPDSSGTVTTRMRNMATHMNPQIGIPVMSLPQTLIDAVTVCRRLSIRYLWIDALCIVQDDEEDWRREAAQMCNIYQFSHVTIAAHRSSACQHGFLGNQKFGQKESQATFWVEAQTTTNKYSPTWTRKQMLLRSWPRDIFSVPQSPLGKRAWTLQELVLPRRVLHFFDHEMAWECQTTHRCECGLKIRFEAPHLPMLGSELRALNKDVDMSNTTLSNVAKLNWMSLVEQYTRRSFSRLSDKLIAMDGLARMVEGTITSTPLFRMPPLNKNNTVIRSEYVEGIFVTDFAQQLMWGVSANHRTVSSPLITSPNPTTRRASPLLSAPSWSWASVDAPVGYPMVYSEKAESLIHVNEFAIHSSVLTNAKVTGVGLSCFVVPAISRQMATIDMPRDRGNVRKRPLLSRPTIVRSLSGLAYGVFFDDIQAPDLSLDDPEMPCWVADDSIYNKQLRIKWLENHGHSTDTVTDNVLARSCQHNRVQYIRHNYDDEGAESDQKHNKSRWCSVCRRWPSDTAAWELIDTCLSKNPGSRNAEVRGLCLLMQVMKIREHGSYSVYFLALQPSSKVPGAWERCGHGRYITWDKDAAHVSLFSGGQNRNLILV